MGAFAHQQRGGKTQIKPFSVYKISYSHFLTYLKSCPAFWSPFSFACWPLRPRPKSPNFSNLAPRLRQRLILTLANTWAVGTKLNYPNWFEKGSCNGAEYKLKPEGGVAVNNSEVLDNGKLSFAIGQARQDPSSNIASHLQVRFSKWQPWGQYLVLDTDYDSFTVVYSCTNLLVARLDFLWF